MKCKYCGYELPDGSKFCFNCGGEQDENAQYYQNDSSYAEETYDHEDSCQDTDQKEEMFCPFCGTKNEGDALFCCSCGRKMTMETVPGKESIRPKKTGMKPLFIGGGIVAAALLIFIAVKLIGGIGGSDEVNYVTYVKDDKIENIDLDSRKKEPVEYKGNIGEDVPSYYLTTGIQYSSDGKYMCYPSNCEGGAFRLNMQRLGKDTSEVVKIDSDVTAYTLLKNNKIIYIREGSRTLFISDYKGNKEKIASDVGYYSFDEAQKNIIWTEHDEDEYLFSLYHQDINLKKDKVKLASDCSQAYPFNNLKTIVVLDDNDTLYVIKDFGEKEKIARDARRAYGSADDGDSFYYITADTEKISAADFVDDDMKTEDDVMEEPDKKDYVKEDIRKNYDGRYEKIETTDWDAYDEAYSKYDEKLNRDRIRESLAEYKFEVEKKALYCYKNGVSEVIDEDCESLYGLSEGVFVYSRYKTEEEMPSVKLSELSYVDDIKDMYEKQRAASVQACAVSKGKVTEIYDGTISSCVFESGSTGYGLISEDKDDEDAASTLISFSLTGKGNDYKEIAADVDSLETVFNGKVYYITDSKRGHGDLYCDDEQVASDVVLDSVHKIAETENIVYATDYNDEKENYTLNVYDGKKTAKVADDVYMYRAFDGKQIAVLVDYRLKREEGDLKLYTGKDELVDLDSDVSCIVGGVK